MVTETKFKKYSLYYINETYEVVSESFQTRQQKKKRVKDDVFNILFKFNNHHILKLFLMDFSVIFHGGVHKFFLHFLTIYRWLVIINAHIELTLNWPWNEFARKETKKYVQPKKCFPKHENKIKIYVYT